MTVLDREEYIEQAYFFRTLCERLPQNMPLQELMVHIREELLATSKLPMAMDFLLTELRHAGVMSNAMARLTHYFTPFQAYVMREAEDERGRFDMRIAVAILQKDAEYRAAELSPQGLFIFLFEAICRNRLRYDPGLLAIANDPFFDDSWKEWILTVRRQVGLVDFADLVYVRSELYRAQARVRGEEPDPDKPVLFGEKEGKIAWANRRKEPLFLFAALQRHLSYPEVPRPQPVDNTPDLIPQLSRRIEQLESRIALMEEEQRGGIDITKFYGGQGPGR